MDPMPPHSRQQELVGVSRCLLGKTVRCSPVSGIEARHTHLGFLNHNTKRPSFCPLLRLDELFPIRKETSEPFPRNWSQNWYLFETWALFATSCRGEHSLVPPHLEPQRLILRRFVILQFDL